MNFLILGGRHGGQLGARLEREGHVVSVERPEHHRVKAALSKTRAEKVISTELLNKQTISTILDSGKDLWGTSLWSCLLQNEDYCRSALNLFSPPAADEEHLAWICGWWNGLSFGPLWCFVEKDKMMNDDWGPLVESSWVTGCLLKQDGPFACFFEELHECIGKTRYKGPVYLSIGTSGGVLGLEAGFRFDAELALSELVVDYAPLFSEASGEVHIRNQTAGALHISLFPWPLLEEGAELFVDEEAAKHVHLEASGLSGCVSAYGIDLSEVRRRIYRAVRLLENDELQLRTDLGKGWLRTKTELFGDVGSKIERRFNVPFSPPG